MHTRFYTVTVLMIGMLILSVVAVVAQDQQDPMQDAATATLQNVEGDSIGTISFAPQEEEGKVLITANFENLPAGFHGFHIHTVGSCDDSGEGPFTAAGDHFNPDGSNHPDHAGDLPVLLVSEDGTAYLSVATDRFAISDLFDEDGSAVIVHSNADNYANIPERYGAPDEETLSAGDSGDRIACGVIQQGGEVEVEATAEPTAAG